MEYSSVCLVSGWNYWFVVRTNLFINVLFWFVISYFCLKHLCSLFDLLSLGKYWVSVQTSFDLQSWNDLQSSSVMQEACRSLSMGDGKSQLLRKEKLNWKLKAVTACDTECSWPIWGNLCTRTVQSLQVHQCIAVEHITHSLNAFEAAESQIYAK